VDISDISLVGAAWGTDIDWAFPTEPNYDANNRVLSPGPRAKVLGSVSSVFYCGDVYERGEAIEYEILAGTAFLSKSRSDVNLTNFNSLFSPSKKVEQFHAPSAHENEDYDMSDHSTTGLLPISYGGTAPEFHNTVIQGVVNAGGVESQDQAVSTFQPNLGTGSPIKDSSKYDKGHISNLHTPNTQPPVTMFARLSAAILLALPLFAVAQTSCSTEKQQCCNSVQDAKSSGVAEIVHSLLGVAVEDVTAQVGLTCTPISVLAISGVSCNQQTVCCENNNFNGLVALGCTPINVNL
ncbi:hypothetical protein H0H93_014268, partial [Arthromyces matolae]